MRRVAYQLVMTGLIVGAVAAFGVHYQLAERPITTAQVGTTEQVVCE